MPLKTILVHVADDDDHLTRLQIARDLARANDAFLSALFLTRPAHMPAGVTGRGASAAFLEEAQERARAKAVTLEAEFNARCAESAVPHRWLIEDGEHLDSLSRHAHVADLVVVSQTVDRSLEGRLSLSLGEALTLTVGCPTLVLPAGWAGGPDGRPLGERVMIAWRENREAVRAVRDAMPLLRSAGSVTVTSVNDHHGPREAPPEEVVAYLRRHGVAAEGELIESANSNVGETLVSRADALKADLLVMGAYGQSSAREILFGGVSRHVFNHMRTPLLASH